jgi:hypothetical protein
MWFDYNEGGGDTCATSVTVNTTAATGSPTRVDVPRCNIAPGAGLQQTIGPKGGLVVTGRPANSWTSLPGFVASRNPYVNRDDLQPWGAAFLTAFATVDTGAFAGTVATSTTGVYGAPHCAAGSPSGWWNCDAGKWYRNPDGSDIQSPWQVKVGASHNLLDIDCYDQAPARGVPVTSNIGARSCER